jgi:endoglucanase
VFDVKAHLKKLVEAHGPSGYEAPVRAILAEEWRGLTDEQSQDGLGSLIGLKKATHPGAQPRKIMLAAHIDEIGMLVRDIVDGFIYVTRISGVDNRVMLSQTVMVHGRNGKQFPGVVAAVPPHLLTEAQRQKYPTWDELIVDVGLPADEVEKWVRIGDPVTVDVPMIELMGHKVAAKAMDDRACVAILTVCLNELSKMHHAWDVYAVGTVQEETGLYGASTAAERIGPDIAIALDVGFAKQPGIEGDDMGAGPVLAIGPNLHPKLTEKLRETAKRYDIKIQDEALAGHTGTDAWAIQISRNGIPTALFSLPLRNMHSPVETADIRDIERTGRLLALFIASLDDDFMPALAWDELKAEA